MGKPPKPKTETESVDVKCQYCGVDYSSKMGITNHLRQMHPEKYYANGNNTKLQALVESLGKGKAGNWLGKGKSEEAQMLSWMNLKSSIFEGFIDAEKKKMLMDYFLI